MNCSFGPSSIYHYNVGTGAINSGVSGGLINKSTSNNGQDITTLVTFTWPQAPAGKKCQFEFQLGNSDQLTGSKKVDVFTSHAPAPGSRSGWGPGNQRNIHIGRITAKLGGLATWDAKHNSYLTEPTACKPAGTVEGLELVGVNDNVHVSWGSGSGPRITFV
ncbi:unnamed protein product [Clonostachys chloroleuca]|uniref:Ubiquitin 3 binding protein But2 C-terminal domain-containing protein n=1 Tax=Clonostachys chloroleuca TaxID=1926264 RepID=A0AA35M890_9HYPO|nr:unnamed protein product [Clonostachys chloroleuca]